MANDELPLKARAILDAAGGACDPTAADRARIDTVFSATLSSHGVMLALGPTAKGVGLAAAGSKSLSVGAKLGLAFAATSALLVAVAQIPGGRTAAPSAQAVAAKTANAMARSTASVPTTTVPTTTAPSAPPTGPSPPLAAPAGPADPLAAKAAGRSTRARPKATGARESAPAASAGTAAKSPQDALQAELALIEGATDALRLGRHANALRLLDEHAARYAAGALREERMGLRVLALCGAGNTRLGRIERQRFLTSAPHSVLAEKVRGACLPSATEKDTVLGDR